MIQATKHSGDEYRENKLRNQRRSLAEDQSDMIVGVFKQEGRANEILNELRHLREMRQLGISNASVISKDAQGKVLVRQMGRTNSIRRRASIGGVTSIMDTVADGPVDGIVFAVEENSTDEASCHAGFKKEELEQIGDHLLAGSSALLATIEYKLSSMAANLEHDEMENVFAQAKREVALRIAARVGERPVLQMAEV